MESPTIISVNISIFTYECIATTVDFYKYTTALAHRAILATPSIPIEPFTCAAAGKAIDNSHHS